MEKKQTESPSQTMADATATPSNANGGRLSAEKEKELACLIQKGETPEANEEEKKASLEAAKELASANLNLVHFVIRNEGISSPKESQYEDYVNAGNEGLLKAARRFDPNQGVRFSTYAYKVILDKVLNFSRSSAALKLSDSDIALRKRIGEVKKELTQLYSREPTNEEIGLSLSDVDSNDLNRVLSGKTFLKSLDEPLRQSDGEDGNSQVDFVSYENDLSPDASILAEEEEQTVQKALSCLSERERQIVILHAGLGDSEKLSFREIAKIQGVSGQAISQIWNRSMTKMASYLRKEKDGKTSI